MAKRFQPRAHTILITGATDGIGLILARSYADRGHHVIATGRKTLADDLSFFGSRNIVYIRADQSEPVRAAQAIAGGLKELGIEHLDLAILNAATGWTGDPVTEDPQSIGDQVTINLTAPVAIAHAVAPYLFRAAGRLVLIGSTAAKGQAAFATYAATKGALDGFSRSLREEWRGRAQVQIIHPGPTRTSMHAKAGLKTSFVRMLFMPAKRAAKAIQRSIRNGDPKRNLTRSYGWGSIFSGAREGEL